MYNCFDRIKVSIPYTDNDKRDELFSPKLMYDTGVISTETHNSVGIRILINHFSRVISLDFSAKILGHNYCDNITILNIKEIYRKINSIINITAREFYSAKPNYCENVTDIHTDDLGDKLNVLYHISKLQTKYKPSPKLFKKANDYTSFWLKKNVNTKTIIDYISIYNKQNELLDESKSENVSYLSSLTEEERNDIINYFSDVLRIESKFSNRTLIRNRYGLTKDFHLYNLLTSNKNMTLDMLQKVYNEELLSKKDYKELTFKDLGRLSTLQQYNFDLDQIYEVEKNMGNTRQRSKVIAPYKDLMLRMTKTEENNKILIVKDVIDMVKWEGENN